MMHPIDPLYNEARLVEMLRNRDKVGFAYLYDRYSGALLGLISDLTGDKDDATGILQEVFISLYRKIDGYDDTKTRLYTWMVGIARNLSIDMLRGKVDRNNQKNVYLPLTIGNRSTGTLSNTGHTGLRSMFGKIKSKHREVLEMNYYKGFSHQEISLMLGLPLGTVKRRIRAAVLELRDIMQG